MIGRSLLNLKPRVYFFAALLWLIAAVGGVFHSAQASSDFLPSNETQRWGMYDDTGYDKTRNNALRGYGQTDPQSGTPYSDDIQRFFGTLESVGNASNAGQADTALMNSACSLFEEKGSAALGQALNQRDVSSSSQQQFSSGRLQSVVFSRARQGVDEAVSAGLSSLCAALTGQGSAGAGLAGGLNVGDLQAMGLNFALNENMNFLKSSGLPFTGHLEVSTGLDGGEYTWEVLTVQPLWASKSGRNHLFTQLSFNRNEDVGDTVNVGLAARRLTENRSVVYGVNAFLDHARTMNHNRMSVGADIQTSQLGVAVNKYIPLSGWKGVDDYTEERASSGFDIELQGRLPEFPSWQLNLTGYKWSSNDDHEQADTFGYDTALEWHPVNALVWEAGLRNEQDDAPQFHTTIRLVYKFGEKLESLWERPVALASAEDRVYEKVHRENTIRTERRTKDSAYVRVMQSDGANVAQTADGSVALSAGQQLALPFKINVSSTVGSLVSLRFKNGATLTIGAGSNVHVEARLITLIFGVMHYVSGSEDVALAAPGASIALLGTDVDLSSNGTTSTLRVRDGSARITGTSSGSAILSAEQAAEAVSGIVGAQLAPTGVSYVNHADTVSTKIDRIVTPLTGSKVAPYPVEEPRLVSEDVSTIVLSLKFNSPVTVSGGSPLIAFTINGNSRTASVSGGSGTDTLTFSYSRVPADSNAPSLTVTGIDANGASVTGNGKDAVLTIADATIQLSVVDGTAPSGYSSVFDNPVNNANKSSASFTISGAETGAAYSYTISSSGGGTAVTGTGTISAATENIAGLDLSGLGDGTLTVSVTLTDTNGNVGGAVTGTTTKDIVGPAVVSVVKADADGLYEPN